MKEFNFISDNILKAIKRITPIVTNRARFIWLQQLDAGKGKFGDLDDYSEKPIYMSESRSPKPQGGQKVGKRGKRISSRFFPRGYKQYKEAQGIKKPNLQDSNSMINQFQPKKVNDLESVLKFTTSNSHVQAKGLTASKGEFVGLDIESEKQLMKEVNKALNLELGRVI